MQFSCFVSENKGVDVAERTVALYLLQLLWCWISIAGSYNMTRFGVQNVPSRAVLLVSATKIQFKLARPLARKAVCQLELEALWFYRLTAFAVHAYKERISGQRLPTSSAPTGLENGSALLVRCWCADEEWWPGVNYVLQESDLFPAQIKFGVIYPLRLFLRGAPPQSDA
jgi:hypothetical protein